MFSVRKTNNYCNSKIVQAFPIGNYDKLKSIPITVDFDFTWKESFVENNLSFNFNSARQTYFFCWKGLFAQFAMNFNNSMSVECPGCRFNVIYFGKKIPQIMGFPSTVVLGSLLSNDIWSYRKVSLSHEIYDVFNNCEEKNNWKLFKDRCEDIRSFVSCHEDIDIQVFYEKISDDPRILSLIKENKKFLINILTNLEKTELYRVCQTTKEKA